jgi:hypothetical protein
VLRSGTVSQDDNRHADGPTGPLNLFDPLPTDGWLSVLGARQIAVQAHPEELAAAAEQIAAGAGLSLVRYGLTEQGLLHGSIGLERVTDEVEAAGLRGAVLAVPALTGAEPAVLASMGARRTAAVPLPLDGLAGSSTGQPTSPFAVVGQIGTLSGDAEPRASVLTVSVSAREAEAARVLVAREEGLLVSQVGAAALAALIRAVREDRARRPRERRFPRAPTAVVVLIGDPLGVDGSPPQAADAIPGRAVTLAELAANPQRLLVEPPGNG